ncbi:MAG TPA: PilN domain-containing protein [Candidatus Methylomirabilis sp.]|nr:PilN domain-containing protein [Candidatus Methylomirabilis sp.]
MIKINLLPQEERKKGTPVNTSVILGALGCVVVLLAMGYGWYWLSQQVGGLQTSITQGRAELKRYEEEAKLVDKFRDDKKKLEEKIKVIATLVSAQGGPVRLLDDVSRALPNEIWLTAVTRAGKKLDVSGIAFSNFSVANFMTNLGKASPLISNVDLVVSEKAVVEQVPVERFSVTMEVKDGKGK